VYLCNILRMYDQVINERDILGTQLIRRNDELALLYEKIKIQQSTLSKGEVLHVLTCVSAITADALCRCSTGTGWRTSAC
jgi:hypothetical protein